MTTTLDHGLLFRSLENALRAGYSLRQALERAAGDFGDPGLTRAAAAASDGVPLGQVFDDWGATHPDIALLAGLVKYQIEAGGNLADRLSLLTGIIERRPETVAT